MESPSPAQDSAASEQKRPTHAALVFVPTPIGNRADITLRALEVLAQADIIACEDTRHSRPLLQHHNIATDKLLSLHSHNEAERTQQLLRRLEQGAYIAVISDAGTPLISDPGQRLVREAIAAGIELEVLPGPSALLPALAASGLACDRFVFEGFLPQKSGRRKRIIEAALEREQTSAFYESPHRLQKTLDLLAELAPTRRCCVARELSKRHEQFHRGSAQELQAYFAERKVRGEVVLLIAGINSNSDPAHSTSSQASDH